MVKPDYKGGSIVNLMSSLEKAMGGRPLYKKLKILKPSEISGHKNIVLIIIDGLGYLLLTRTMKKGILIKNLKGSITSVFPSSTTSALTTFYTGVAPKQHALTGWFMWLKEAGMIIKTLPFSPRAGGRPLSLEGMNASVLLNEKPFTDKINRKSFLITDERLIDSDYSLHFSGKAEVLPYKNMKTFFSQIKNAVHATKKVKFITAYWPKIDTLSHDHGAYSNDVRAHLNGLDIKFRRLAKDLQDTDTLIIITSDHGSIETKEKSKMISIHDHPKLEETLRMPLCGEPRYAYCYVKSGKEKRFEKYVKENLTYCCEMHRSEDIVKQGLFGLYKQNKKLGERIGDYILLMKDNYIIKDFLPNEEKKFLTGNHGGLTDEEMLVPLIFIGIGKNV